jgi:hypothetical protein
MALGLAERIIFLEEKQRFEAENNYLLSGARVRGSEILYYKKHTPGGGSGRAEGVR